MIMDPAYFRDVLSLLREHSWLFSVAVTELLVEDVLTRVPPEWASVLLAASNEDLNGLAMCVAKDDWPTSLSSFLRRCQELRIPVKTVDMKYCDLSHDVMRGLTSKKQHEVLRLSALVSAECSAVRITHVLDVGSGLGYLDRLLNYRYDFSVTGLDIQEDYVKKAIACQAKLRPTTEVRHIACDVSSDVSSLTDIPHPSCIVGLHTCGDLSVDTMRLFLQLHALQLLVVVPCCYHKMAVADDMFSNFPLSCMLSDLLESDEFKECKGFLKRPFMRLASQETGSRWQHMLAEEHVLHGENMVARAVLQLCVHREGLTLKKQRRRGVTKTNRSTFETFLEDTFSRYAFVSDKGCDRVSLRKLVQEEWLRNKHLCGLAEVLTGLQLALQGVAESLVLADRVAFLQEHGISSLEVVKVMDDTVSPRCFALVARK